MQNTSIKSRKVTEVIGLLGLIALCVACLANPFATSAGNNPNSVVLIHDYGSIKQLRVMPHGQLAMKLHLDGTFHGVNHKLALPSADNITSACATSDAQAANKTFDAKNANKTPGADDTCKNTTASNKVAIAGSQIPAGHILAVQFGTSQVICISLPKGQCLMSGGRVMDLKS